MISSALVRSHAVSIARCEFDNPWYDQIVRTPTVPSRMRVNYAHVASFQAVKSLFAKLQFLTLRDVKLRYKQTALGVAWAAIQPLFTMAVFTVFFGNLG